MAKGLKIVKKVDKLKPKTKRCPRSKYPNSLGKVGFVMDRDTFLSWYD